MWYNRQINATALRQQPVAWPNLCERIDMAILPHAAGIYCITCIPTSKVYIGSTIDLRKRWYWHKGDLRAKRHHNRHLQNAWNKYGADSFTFSVLELVDVTHLEDREQYWLDAHQAFNPKLGFNLGPSARAPMSGYVMSVEARKRLSECAIQRNSIAIAIECAREWHGTEEGRAWHSKHGIQAYAQRELKKYTCNHCAAQFETKDTKAQYCSNRCRAAARRARGVDDVIKSCEECSNLFTSNRYDRALYCSRRCARRAR